MQEIKVPSMGESITEASVASLLKKSGSFVKADEGILELETDKINQVIYAPVSGTLNFNVGVGDVVTIGQVIGSIDPSEQDAVENQGEKAPSEPPKEIKPTPTPAPPPQPKSPTPVADTHKFKARIGVDDFVDELSKPTPSPSRAPTQTPSPTPSTPVFRGGERREKMTRIRQSIAKRLVEAQQTAAMLTTFNEIDLSAVIEERKLYKDQFQKKHGVKLGFMSFFAKAVVRALQTFPAINGRIEGDEIVYPENVHLGIAISSPRGLIVPVIRKCEELSYAQIEQSIIDFVQKAKEGTLRVEDLTGGTFTITNGGTFGSLLSTPILNAPQSGILGMHAIQERPVAHNGQVVIRPMMYVALSYDHRIVDGREAVSFLVEIKQALEDPARLLLDV